MVSLAIGGCSSARNRVEPMPVLLQGRFDDDYGSSYTITNREWLHGSRSRYHILKVNAAEQYLIAQNDRNNPGGEQLLYSRIDWMPLQGMSPYEWAFCMTAYKAVTANAAEDAAPAGRSTPRTGCNGFPFTRMKRNP